MAKEHINWTELRLEYIKGSMSIRELCEARGLKVSQIEKRCAVEGWLAEREALAEKIRRTATESFTKSRGRELADWNANDLKVAKALRGKIAQRLSRLDEASRFFNSDLRSLAQAAESAQRMARLALGATTENTGLSTPDGDPLPPPTLGDFYASFASYRERVLKEKDTASGEAGSTH
jgi:hypothetical protein